MPSVIERIRMWGRRKGLKGDESSVLKQALSRNIKISEIISESGCSPQALRYQLRKIGVNSFRQSFEEKLKELGYRDIRSFFTDKRIVYKSMKELSVLTGFCCPTISKYYHKFLESTATGETK